MPSPPLTRGLASPARPTGLPATAPFTPSPAHGHPADHSLDSLDSIEFILDPEDRSPEPYWLTGLAAPASATPRYLAGSLSTSSSVSAASGATEVAAGGSGGVGGVVERGLDAYWAPAGVPSPVPIVRRNSTPNCVQVGGSGDGALSVVDGLKRGSPGSGLAASTGGAGGGGGVPRMLGGRLVPGLTRIEQRIADRLTEDASDFAYHNTAKPLSGQLQRSGGQAQPVAGIPEIPPYAPRAQAQAQVPPPPPPPHSSPSTSPLAQRHNQDRRGSTQLQYAALKASKSHHDHAHPRPLSQSQLQAKQLHQSQSQSQVHPHGPHPHSRQDQANAHSLDHVQHHVAALLATVHALQAEQAAHHRQWDAALYRMDQQLLAARDELAHWKERAFLTERVAAEIEARLERLEERGGDVPKTDARTAAAEKQAIRDTLRAKLGVASPTLSPPAPPLTESTGARSIAVPTVPVAAGQQPLAATTNAPPLGIRTGPSSPRKGSPMGHYFYHNQNRQPRKRGTGAEPAATVAEPGAGRAGGMR